MSVFADPRDRTQDFFSIVQLLKKQSAPNRTDAFQSTTSSIPIDNCSKEPLLPSSALALRPKPPPSKFSQFTEAAKNLNGGITSIAEKLQELGKRMLIMNEF